MLRRIAAVGLLTIASFTFALRFSPPVTEGADLDEILSEIEARPAPRVTVAPTPSFGTLPPPTTTTTEPLPPGVRQYQSDYVVFSRGALQLEITVEYGELVDIEMIRIPSSSSRAKQISIAAGRELRAEALELTHYRLHVVSGATETSYMYMRAMRDALEQAEFCVHPKCHLHVD